VPTRSAHSLKAAIRWAAAAPGFGFNPGGRVNDREMVLRMKDGRPRMRVFSFELGCSDEAVAE